MCNLYEVQMKIWVTRQNVVALLFVFPFKFLLASNIYVLCVRYEQFPVKWSDNFLTQINGTL
jgi:hypothetical protein